jgi:cobalt-zinc-cadmium efflux system membrane fusion protein
MAIPDRRAAVGPRVAGRVVRATVNVGDRVEAGTPLVVLDSAEVGRARADLVAAAARRDVADRAYKRAEALLEGRVTSERSVEEAHGDLQVIDADLQAAKTRLRAYGVPVDDSIDNDPGQVILRSPIAGTVVSRSVSLGQWIEPSEVVMEIVDLDRLWLLASVYELEMRHVVVDQGVDVKVRAFPGEVFSGLVDSIDPTLDERTRSVSVRVVLPNPGHRLRPGMFATALIRNTHTHEPRKLLAIPWAAIQEVDGHPAVFVRVEEGVFELRSVHTGERAGSDVEILNGLTPGETVVTEGSFLLKGELLSSTLGEDE